MLRLPLALSCACGATCIKVLGCVDRVCHLVQGSLYGLRLYLCRCNRLRARIYRELSR